MRHSVLTCKNHPELRWSCKECAVSPGKPGESAHYNGSRSIFFDGKSTGELYADKSGVECIPAMECQCPSSDLVFAPEDPLVI